MISSRLVFGFMVVVTLGSLGYYTLGDSPAHSGATHAGISFDGDTCPYSGAFEGECPYLNDVADRQTSECPYLSDRAESAGEQPYLSESNDPKACPFLNLDEEAQKKVMDETGKEKRSESKCPYLNGEKSKNADEIDI